MRVAIVVPSRDMVHASFTFCLTNLVAATATGIEIVLINPRSSSVVKGRNVGVKQALECGADYILFIDSDQTFPADSLRRLLAHRKMVVGAASVTRQYPVDWTARDSRDSVISFTQRKGLHRVESNGFSLMLLNTKIFDESFRFPWFDTYYKTGGVFVSEDQRFCENVRHSVWVDADLSREVGHLGTKCFTCQDIGEK